MYQFTKRELEDLGKEGWNIIICPTELEAKQVQSYIKNEGMRARCGCIRNANKELLLFVVTNKPIKKEERNETV